MSRSELVEVYAAANAQEAQLLKMQLADAGIDARVVGDVLQAAGGELPLGWSIAPRIWVPAEDVGRAREIITRCEDRPRSDDAARENATWACPNCGARVPADFEICWRCERARAAS